MKGKTRNFNNQWLIQANRNTNSAIFNYERILKSVQRWDKHYEIIEQLNEVICLLRTANSVLPVIQFLFNDPRAVKIEV